MDMNIPNIVVYYDIYDCISKVKKRCLCKRLSGRKLV